MEMGKELFRVQDGIFKTKKGKWIEKRKADFTECMKDKLDLFEESDKNLCEKNYNYASSVCSEEFEWFTKVLQLFNGF